MVNTANLVNLKHYNDSIIFKIIFVHKIRLSVGIEDVEDLIADLDQALKDSEKKD
jgi:O-acetylhomoserine/O-acetylserine sulfhydrylase-like pyridoxal-dependent enzyme